jgi:hypothetical protein
VIIYPNELEVTDTTEAQKSASYLDPHLAIDNGGRLKTNYNNRDYFIFPIVNFPFIGSNIPASPEYGVSYVILELVPSTVIFWTELSC